MIKVTFEGATALQLFERVQDFLRGPAAPDAMDEPTESVEAVAFPSGPVVLPAGAVPATPVETSALVVPVEPTVAINTPASTLPGIDAEVDAAGLPWDERIHTRTKSKNDNGRWRTRRNTPAATIAQVEAELRTGQPEAPAAASTGIPAVTAPVQPVASVVAPVVNGPDVAACIALASQLLDCGGTDEQMQAIGADMTAVLTLNQLASTNDLNAAPEKCPTVYAGLTTVRDKWLPGAP